MRVAIAIICLVACSCNKGPVSISVSPNSGTVLTCATQQFSATETNSSGTSVVWSVQSGAGSIAQSGLYSAPSTVPSNASVDVRATASAGPSVFADAQITLATAVPSAQIAVTGAQTSLGDHSWAHLTAASGTRVYAVWPGPSSMSPQTMIQSSNDGGKTWSSAVTAITVHLARASDGQQQMDCVAVAVDASNPDVVYVYAFQDEPTQEGNTAAGGSGGDTAVFAVSTDGGKTFKQAVMRVGQVEICGDIISPAANTVVIEAPESGVANIPDQEYNQDAVVWSDTSQGAAFFGGVASVDHTRYTANGETHALDDILTDASGKHALAMISNGASASPELFTDGKGKLCVTYQGDLDANNSGQTSAWVQCSSDLGKTFSAPQAVNGSGNWASEQPVGAMSPDGHVAILWATGDNSASGDFLTISADGGKTFGAPITVPSFTAPSINSAVTGGNLSMYYDSANVLWFVYSPYIGNGQEWLVVDKTCDEGQSFSGLVVVNGATASALQNLHRGVLAMTTGAPLIIAVSDVMNPPTLSAITLAP